MISDSLKIIRSAVDGFDAQLIAVSKQQSDEKINEALDLGLRTFGENRVQEAQSRWAHRRDLYSDLKLHLIGPLQTNKVKDACTLFNCIHTLDREKLARAIYKHAPDMPCFIQVNTGNEPQKAGISLENLDNFHQFCVDLGIKIIGLMCIPPLDDRPDSHFKTLEERARSLNLPNLSMGMSGDYDIALEYGATHIRVGSKLFGKR